MLEIRVPEELINPSSSELWHALLELEPVFFGYFVSFAVLTAFWMAHSYFFSEVVKEINRQLVLLNMIYLAFVSLLPFSSYLLGRYPEVQAAILIYGFNVLIIALFSALRTEYAIWSKEIDTAHNPRRLVMQSRVRLYLTIITTLIGILASFISFKLALILYAFPIVFNIIPGLLNLSERILGFRLGEN